MFRHADLVLLAATVFLRPISAQESVNLATLSGRVTDPAGSIVQGANVAIRQVETNLSKTGITDREGRFRFPYLNVGRYEVVVHQLGFNDAGCAVLLTIGSAFDLPITLSVGAAATTKITVAGDAAILESARSQIAGTVSQAEVGSLPINGRNFLDLALLVPGVSPTNTASNQLFAETSAVPGQGLSIGSQRNFSNNFIVDGLSANDDAAGLSGIFYGLDVVSEFQVVTSGGQAELGRAMGGYVNMVTRSGSNSLHGDLYGFFRNQRFNAANPLSNSTLPITQAQYGASLGGPVVKDRTFYFANFEQRSLEQSGLITITPANVTTINQHLAAIGYQGEQISTGIYPNPVHSTNFLSKLDHQFTQNDELSLRYSLYAVNADNSRGAGALSAPSASANLDDLDQTLAVSNIATFSARTINETRGQFTYSNLKAPPSDPVGPAVNISGIASFGTLSGSPTARLDKLVELADNFSHQSGAHALRFGVDFLYNDLAITFPRSIRGSYSFSSLSNFLSGTYNNSGFTQTFGNPLATQSNPNVGFYAQDEWKPLPGLTFNFGLRYDLQFLDTIQTDIDNLSPRLGFAWSPFASRRTVFRGSYGLFYDRVPLRPLANALLSESGQVSLSLSPGQTGAPVFPNILSAVPTGVLASRTVIDPHLQNAYSEQGSFEIEHQFTTRSSLTAGYEHLRGLHLLISVNQNVPTCVAAGSNNGCRPNPNFGNISRYSSLADSHYDGLYLSFVQRPVRWGSYRVSYTFSKALDNVGEFFFSAPINNHNIWQDYGRSDDDQRHRVVFDGTIHARGFQFSGILQYYSALPLNIVTGANTIQGTAARPMINGVFINRNAGTGPDFFNVSLRLSREFAIREGLRLEAMAEAFNALNHTNPLTLNGTFGTGQYPMNPLPAFGQVTAVNDPRSLQFALRLKW